MNNLKFSNRILAVTESPIRKLRPLVQKAEEMGATVYRINIGQPDLASPDFFLNAVTNFNDRIVGYALSEGLPQLRTAWARYYHEHKMPIEENDLIVTAGGSEGLLWAMGAICNSGDEILVPEPFFSSYKSIAAFLEVKLVPITTHLEDGFRLPVTRVFERAVTEKTRGILINHPCNPTGVVFPKCDLARLADFVKEQNLFVISDEAYRDVAFVDGSVGSMLEFTDVLDRTIIIDSVSKRFNLCGARVGCIASVNGELMRHVLKLAQARLAVATIEQLAAIPVLEHWVSLSQATRESYRDRRDAVWSRLSQIKGIRCVKPEGALYIIVECPIDDSDYFARWCITEFRDRDETVWVAPAEDFYMTAGRGVNEVRIAFVLPIPKMMRALELFELALQQYPGRTN